MTSTSQNEQTTSVTSRIPPEVTDAIIDAGKDDKRFLKTCSLVCRAWVPASRHHLFERLTLDNLDTADFNRLLQCELVRHIRHLTITRSHVSSQLEHGIGSFQSLTKLCIFDSYFDSFNDLANFLLTCHILEELSLNAVSWSRTSASVPMAGSLPSLRHLDIRFVTGPEDIISWLLSWQPVPALQSFAFYPLAETELENVPHLNTLLQAVGSSLQNLDIDGALTYSWDLSQNKELRTVTFGLDVEEHQHSLTRILSSLGPISSSIRDVVFDISKEERVAEDDNNRGYIMDLIDFLDFRELDQLLCAPEFLYLEAISIHLNEITEWRYWGFERMIRQQMPASFSRGILSIQNLNSFE